MTVASYNGSYAITPGGYFVHPPLPNSALKWSAMNEYVCDWVHTRTCTSFSADPKLDKYVALKFDYKYGMFDGSNYDRNSAFMLTYVGALDKLFGNIYQRAGSAEWGKSADGTSVAYFNTIDNVSARNFSYFNGTYNISSNGSTVNAYDPTTNSAEYNTFKYVREVWSNSAKYSAFVNDELKASGILVGSAKSKIDLSFYFYPYYVSATMKNAQLATFRNEQLAAEW